VEGVRVANAPCTFGVFDEVAPTEVLAGLGGSDDLLAAVHQAGYEGIDLGPFDYLGSADDLGERLSEHDLSLVGGWLEFHFSDAEAFAADLSTLDRKIDVYLAGVTGNDDRFWPKPTMADAGSDARRAHPGGRSTDVDLALSAAEWDGFAERVEIVADGIRARGLTPTFHHHACTYVETPEEIAELLARTSVGLCLDSGHMLIGGGDPVSALHEWAPRVNHIHVKDCKLDVVRQAVAEGASMRDIWGRKAFCRIGTGDLDVGGYLGEIAALGYSGWVVVEQDLLPDAADTFEAVTADQRANREFLRAHGF
jgi:inosose dehydratase